VEDRSSWLPAGLESSHTDPDDRSWQRAEKAGKRANPTAAAGRPPYDQDRPESKRGKAKPAFRASGGDEQWKPEPEPKRKPESKPKPEPKQEPEPKPEPKPEAKPKRQPKPKPQPSKPEPEKPEPKKPEPVAAKGGAAATPSKAAPPARPSQQAREAQQPRQPAPSERSDVDAMGQDKHRQVVGQRYGASRARQFAYYGIFIAFVVGAYLGLSALADSLDKAPARDPDKAPWSKPDSPQVPLGGFETGESGPTKFQ
jgi:outer membrane biosynthesis protein TonB